MYASRAGGLCRAGGWRAGGRAGQAGGRRSGGDGGLSYICVYDCVRGMLFVQTAADQLCRRGYAHGDLLGRTLTPKLWIENKLYTIDNIESSEY